VIIVIKQLDTYADTTVAKPIDPQYNSCVKENYSINYSVTD